MTCIMKLNSPLEVAYIDNYIATWEGIKNKT